MLLGKAKILRSHGWQYIPNLDGVTLTEEFRGFPMLTVTDDKSDVERAAAICPTGAINPSPLTLDMGKCLFCGEPMPFSGGFTVLWGWLPAVPAA